MAMNAKSIPAWTCVLAFGSVMSAQDLQQSSQIPPPVDAVQSAPVQKAAAPVQKAPADVAATAANQTPATQTPATQAAQPPQVAEHENGIATSTSVSTVSASQVRIVRLSQVMGKVQMDRNTSNGFEPTFTNLPIVQGSKLKTAEGVAEVEFEDNSSLRLAPDSQVDFDRLGRDTSGATANGFKLAQGTLYLSLANTKGNEFVIAAGNEKITLTPTSHVRLDVYPAGSELTVFKGGATVTDPTGTYTVTKGKAFSFGGANATALPVIAKDDTPGLYDKWDKQSVDYHNARMNVSSFAGGSGYQYGMNDLNYYGSFSNIAGCGQVWQPYFTSAAWSPYQSGVWAYYPGAGYSFVSPYPWGWTPYHSGSWVSCGNAGWGWQPGTGGNSWRGLNNVAAGAAIKHPVVTAGSGPGVGGGPVHRQPSLVVVGSDAVHVSRIGASQKFEFAKDSAGMGVPRQAFGNLQKPSQQVATHGMAQARVNTEAMSLTMRSSATAGSAGTAIPVARSGALASNRRAGAGAGASGSAAMHAAPMSRPVAPAVSRGGSSMGGGAMQSRGSSSGGAMSNSRASAPMSAPSAPSGGGVHK